MKTFKNTKPMIVSEINFNDVKPGEVVEIANKLYLVLKQGMEYKLVLLNTSETISVGSFDIHKPTINKVFKTNGNCRLLLDSPYEDEEIDDEIRE